jgi:hypothetical protein
MSTHIDTMIDIISSDIPEFLDGTKPEDREIFSHLSYMILMGKIISVDRFLGIVAIDSFTDSFLERYQSLIDSSDNIEKINKSYDYITEFYMNLFNYLVNSEEYEMCSNFRNFIDRFNQKSEMDEL